MDVCVCMYMRVCNAFTQQLRVMGEEEPEETWGVGGMRGGE